MRLAYVDWLRSILSPEALARIDVWESGPRLQLTELLEDATSDLQREMIQRALAAGRSLPELHAFADELRSMPDEDVYAACTPRPGTTRTAPLWTRLRTEADPLHAFVSNGHHISPRDQPAETPPDEVTERRVPKALLAQSPPTWPRPSPIFDAISPDDRRRAPDVRDLGASREDPISKTDPKLGAEVLNQAVQGFGLRYVLRVVDTPSYSLEDALTAVRTSLLRGYVVPVVLGEAAQKFSRYAVLLQMTTSGTTRAFQLHEPTGAETVWINEGDLLRRADLRLSARSLRQLTAVALPQEVSR